MKPEMVVRSIVHGLGYRYRIHRSDLPGKPDLVFGPRRKVIFVHGCFWHGHDDLNCVDGRRRPKSNLDYWLPKLTRNRMRDEEHVENLITLGWSVFLVWECQIKYKDVLADKIKAFLK